VEAKVPVWLNIDMGLGHQERFPRLPQLPAQLSILFYANGQPLHSSIYLQRPDMWIEVIYVIDAILT
jgi:hypothetical protein